MIYPEFIELYIKEYKIDLNKNKVRRLSGRQLVEMKLLVYISRIYFGQGFSAVSKALQLAHRQSAMVFYYDVLGTAMYRDLSEERYRKICRVHLEHLNELKKQNVS